MSMHRPGRRDRESGQIIVLFVLVIVAAIAMVGLVLDGGDTYAQRRAQQSAADLSALAGANAYLNTTSGDRIAAATAAARDAATRNGYTQGSADTAVDVAVTLGSTGAIVRVGISRPHTNNFARIPPLGQASWLVSVTASALTGAIDTGMGAAPWTMHIDAFNGDGSPKYGPSNPQDFGETNGDYPTGAMDIAWTDYNGADNVNTSEVRGIITGSNIVKATMEFDQYIGQHNQGNHTALYSDVDAYLAGRDVPVPVVGSCPNNDPSAGGCFKGWVMFHVISASGGSSKHIRGYFLDDFVTQPLTVGECTAQMQAAGACGEIPESAFDAYVVRLDS